MVKENKLFNIFLVIEIVFLTNHCEYLKFEEHIFLANCIHSHTLFKIATIISQMYKNR